VVFLFSHYSLTVVRVCDYSGAVTRCRPSASVLSRYICVETMLARASGVRTVRCSYAFIKRHGLARRRGLDEWLIAGSRDGDRRWGLLANASSSVPKRLCSLFVQSDGRTAMLLYLGRRNFAPAKGYRVRTVIEQRTEC